MGGKGSGRKPGAKKIISNLKARPQVKQPVATDMFLPNYSVVKGTRKMGAKFDNIDAHSICDSSDNIFLIDCNAQFKGYCAPLTDSTYDMGTNAIRWRTIYADNLTCGNLTYNSSTNRLANYTAGEIDFVNNDLKTSGSIKHSGTGGFDIYPENQATIGLRIAEDGTNLELSGLGTSTIEFLDNVDLGAHSLTVNSVEIVGSDGEVNKAAVEDSSNWDTAYTHSQDNSQAHSDYLINNGNDTSTGKITAANFEVTGDNTSADTAYVPMVLFNTDATPPTASNFPKGTIYVQYTA